MSFSRLPRVLPMLLLISFAEASGCADSGVACGSIDCPSDQLCAPPRYLCERLRAGETCAAEDRCRAGTELAPAPGCERSRHTPGLCFEVPASCEGETDCACLRESIEPLRCLTVVGDGYVLVE